MPLTDEAEGGEKGPAGRGGEFSATKGRGAAGQGGARVPRWHAGAPGPAAFDLLLIRVTVGPPAPLAAVAAAAPPQAPAAEPASAVLDPCPAKG